MDEADKTLWLLVHVDSGIVVGADSGVEVNSLLARWIPLIEGTHGMLTLVCDPLDSMVICTWSVLRQSVYTISSRV